MSSKSLLSAFVLFTVFELVFGATCIGSTTCVASTYTTGTCDSTTKVCACLAGSAPIPTGCGSKLAKPTVAQPAGYSTVLLEGKSATLTCTSPDGATLFEWTLDGVLQTSTASTYTTNKAGTYTCKAKFSGNSNLDSDPSDGLILEILLKSDKNTSLTNVPTVFLPTKTLFNKKSVNVTCINIPIGYDPARVQLSDFNGNSMVSPVEINGGNNGAELKCELTDFPTSHINKITGYPTYLPSIVTGISAAKILSTAVDGQVYTVDETITLNCVTTPDVPYIDTTSEATITYSWLNNDQTLSESTSQTYDIPKLEGVYVIKCEATYSTSVQSMAITITRNSTYLTKPVINVDPATPVLGRRFTLACGSVVDGATYSWKKNGTEIAREFEQIIQIDNATTSDAEMVYVCTAKRSMITQTSDSFTFSFADITAAAISSTAVNGEVYTVDETINLKCVTTPDAPFIGSTTKAVTYVWMNNDQILSGATSQTYDIPKAEGVYVIKCQATYTASFQSAVITITRNNTYLTKPVIKADPTTPVLGSKFTLACGSAVDGATYSWKKNGTEIARQLEQIIQIDNATTSDVGVYECTAKRSKVIRTSDSFTLSFNSAPEIVKISMLVLGLTLLMSKVFA